VRLAVFNASSKNYMVYSEYENISWTLGRNYQRHIYPLMKRFPIFGNWITPSLSLSIIVDKKKRIFYMMEPLSLISSSSRWYFYSSISETTFHFVHFCFVLFSLRVLTTRVPFGGALCESSCFCVGKFVCIFFFSFIEGHLNYNGREMFFCLWWN
jgi:hypothetical protein